MRKDKVLVAECNVAKADKGGDSNEVSEARRKAAGEANLNVIESRYVSRILSLLIFKVSSGFTRMHFQIYI